MNKTGIIFFSALFFVMFFSIHAFATDVVSITSPANATNTTDTTPEIRFNVTGDNATYNFTIYVNGIAEQPGNVANATMRSINLTAVANGTFRIYVESLNVSLRTNSSLLTIYVDDGAPSINFNSPVNATNTTDTTPEIAFNATDVVATSDLNVTIFVNGAAEGLTLLMNNNTETRRNLSALANGTHRVQIQVKDTAGNIANSTLRTIYVSDSAPTVNLNQPTYGTNFTDTTPELSFNATSTAYATGLNVTIFVNGSANQAVFQINNNTETRRNLSGLGNGTFPIRVQVMDGAGNVRNSSEINITIDDQAPTATLLLSKTSVGLGTSLTISCSATDLHTGINSTSLTVTKPNSAIVAHTCDSSFTDTNALGTYTVSFTATDLVAHSGSASATFTVTGIEGGGSSGGGGGGGGGASLPKSTTIISDIQPGVEASVSVKKSEIAVTKIDIDVKSAAKSVELTVTKYNSKPATVTEVSGSAYQYLDINVKKLANENIQTAKITFTVTNSWLSAQGLGKNDVVLQRFADNQWQELPTTLVGEDATTFTYQATSPGFSVFAITAKAAQPAPETPAEQPQPETPTETPPAQQPSQPAQTTQPSRPAGAYGSPFETSSAAIAGVVIIVIVVLAGFYFYYHKSQRRRRQ